MIKFLNILVILTGWSFVLSAQDLGVETTQEVVYKIVNDDTLKLRLYYPDNHDAKNQ